MTSISEQVFFFVAEKHPWILTQFREAQPHERICVKTESQMKLSSLESLFQPMDLELDTTDDAKLRNSCQNDPSKAILSDPWLCGSSQNERNTLSENMRDGTRNNVPNESRTLALYHPKITPSGQNNIRDSATHRPDDDYENRRKLRKRRKNKARRRNISRKLAQYNEWKQIIYCVNNQLLGPCRRPYSQSTPKPRWAITY